MQLNDFRNEEYKNLSSNDYLICTIGYEERSVYLLNKNIASRNRCNTFLIFFDDFSGDAWFNDTKKIIEEKRIEQAVCAYEESDKYIELIIQCVNSLNEGEELYIDYSSIPRSWYCGLLLEINRRKNEFTGLPIHFLYSAGEYPVEYSACGIGSLNCFVGQMLPTLSITPDKLHIIALGYDPERTQSLITKIEPDFLLACYAYTKVGSRNQLEEVNKELLERVSAYVSLQLNDFEGMISTLNEIILEHTRYGQVVIIPDGPKPLIFAMSMVSIINAENKRQIVCLHVSRNNNMLDEHKVPVHASKIENDIYCVKYTQNDK